MIRGIDHIEVIVRNLDESIDFFQKLGFALLIRTSHHGGSAELQLPGEHQPIFEIHQVSGEENIGINHIAFKVDALDPLYERLVAHGVTSVSKPVTPTIGPNRGGRAVYVIDPDGFRVELIETRGSFADFTPE